METPLLIVDASTLVNFLFVGRFDLVRDLGHQVRIVDAVYEEIQAERKELDELIEQDHLRTMTLEGDAFLNRLTSLINRGLDTGEAFTVAAAIERGAIVAMDDRRAIKKSREESPDLAVVTSTDIIVAGIKSARISVEAADGIKAEWSLKHRFNLKFQSFQELIRK